MKLYKTKHIDLETFANLFEWNETLESKAQKEVLMRLNTFYHFQNVVLCPHLTISISFNLGVIQQ